MTRRPDTPRSATRIGALATVSALAVAVLVASTSDSVTEVVAATWQASGALGGAR